MELPEIVGLCRVEGNFLEARLDGPDADVLPEAAELIGFTALLEAVEGAGDRPVVLRVPEPSMRLHAGKHVLTTNQVGEVVNPKSPDSPIDIVATDQPWEREFLWKVTVSAPGWPVLTGYSDAPTDGVLDLANVIEYLEIAPSAQSEFVAMVNQVLAASEGISDAVVQVAADAATAVQARNEAVAIAAGDILDDELVSDGFTWSSQEITEKLSGKSDLAHAHNASQITSGTLSYLRLPTATQSTRGALETSTDAEAIAGALSNVAVTPASLHAAAGPLVQAGIVAAIGETIEVPWLWRAGTQQVLSTPTHDGSGESTHPSVLYFEDGWNGWKYWMAHTPYPGGNEAHEDPNLLVSADGVSWQEPAPGLNPLDDQAGNPAPHNSDTNLVMRNGIMHLLWRMVDRPNGNATRLFWRTSTNGTTWTAKQEIFTPAAGLLAPSLVWTGARWELFGMEGSSFVRWHTTVVSPTTSTTWTRTVLSAPRPEGIVRWWHVEVKRHGDLYMGTFNGYDERGAARGGELFLGLSADGQNWRISDTPLLPAAPAGHSRYAGTTIVKAGSGIGMELELFFGRIEWVGSTQVWRILRAPLTSPSTVGGVALRAREAQESRRSWVIGDLAADTSVGQLDCYNKDGRAHMTGQIVRSAGAGTPSPFRLGVVPSGSRPDRSVRRPVAYGTAVAQMRVETNGEIFLWAHDNGTFAGSVTVWVDAGWGI